MSVGSNIKKRRLELRMSQQDLADAMGYKTRSTITKIESGENDVSQKKLQKFAAVLNTTVEELISMHAANIMASEQIIAASKQHKTVVIVLAGGNWGNNRQNIPTQFVNVHGKPILVHSLDAYQSHPAVDEIYIVCLKGWESITKAYAQQYNITKLKGLIPAGVSGVISLRNALNTIRKTCSAEDLVIIQEATRPMVRAEMISQLLHACEEKRSATICHSMQDYVQFNISEGKAAYINRNAMIALQSPEAHKFSLLNEVFDKAKLSRHTLTESCCTMLMYNLRYPINFIEGNVNNIKISGDEDIAAFSAWVKALYD